MNIFVFPKMKLVNQCHTSIVCNITGERQSSSPYSDALVSLSCMKQILRLPLK